MTGPGGRTAGSGHAARTDGLAAPAATSTPGAAADPLRPGPVCLDLDGCLVDSAAAITEAVVAALDHLGVATPPADTLGWCVGPPLQESMARLLADAGEDPARAGEAVDAYRAVYALSWPERTRVFDGVEEVLVSLVGAGRELAVVTSKPLPLASSIVEELGLARWLPAVFAPDPDDRSEPKTATLARALAARWPGHDPANVTMVGDRSHDVVAGQACGTATVGVTWGAGDRGELEAAGADRVVDTAQQLRAALLGW